MGQKGGEAVQSVAVHSGKPRENEKFEATRRIRQMESMANEQIQNPNDGMLVEVSRKDLWHMPILAMTADVIQATYEECMKCGMDGYVSKPFEEKQLYQAVAKFFRSQSISDT